MKNSGYLGKRFLTYLEYTEIILFFVIRVLKKLIDKNDKNLCI